MPGPVTKSRRLERTSKTPELLIDALRELLPDSSGRTRKQYLEHGRVRVNGTIVRIGKTPLQPGDVVDAGGTGQARSSGLKDITLLYEDEDVIVIDKAAGLLTIATDKDRFNNAYRKLSEHVKKSDRRAKIFIVHRLDRLASGLLVFAKNMEAKRGLQRQLRAHSIERVYIALCCGRPRAKKGTIQTPLSEDKSGRVSERRDALVGEETKPQSSKNTTARRSPQSPRDARTHWVVLDSYDEFSLLEVRLETGRKHQIRVHLAGRGNPVCGDPVYGATVDPLGRLALHARTLLFDHPRTGIRLRFDCKVPWSTRKYRFKSSARDSAPVKG